MLPSFLIFSISILFSQNVGINSSGNPPHSSTGLDVDFTDKGFLVPRMTTAQRDAIQNPAYGLQIYNTTTNCVDVYFGLSTGSGIWRSVQCGCLSYPDATFSALNPPFVAGDTITFVPNNPIQGVTYDWAYTQAVMPTGMGQTSASSWFNSGVYDVTLVATTAQGCVSTHTIPFNVACPTYLNTQVIKDFAFTGSPQQFTVPNSVIGNEILIEVWGAEGGHRGSNNGGKGGYSTGTLITSPGQVLDIRVGGNGNSGNGYNGGGISQNANIFGGGASDVRIGGSNLSNRIIVAGGGGSVGASNKNGGYGGGINGESRTETYGSGGGGASQIAGGAGGSNNSGVLGIGGNGQNQNGGYGGAGGGGYYGGGGVTPDGSGDDDRGGGGGSGYTSPTLTNSQTIAGNATMPNPNGGTMTGNLGNGFVRLKYNLSVYGSINGQSSVCQGSTLTYTIPAIPDAQNYTWTANNGATINNGQGTNSISVTFPNNNTTVDITVFATNSCNQNSVPVTYSVTVLSPIATFTPLTAGVNTPIQFQAQNYPGMTYAWTFDQGTPASGAVYNPTSQWNSIGTYDVTLTISDPSGCISSNTQQITIMNCVTGQSQDFVYTGAVQTFTIPNNICNNVVTIEVWGAQGGSYGGLGGNGGYSIGTLNVTLGQVLNIYVGGQGLFSTTSSQVIGGWNGGGSTYGFIPSSYASSGGGASDVRVGGFNLSDRVIVAGGGGGGGSYNSNAINGGVAGGLTGVAGVATPGYSQYTGGGGGTQVSGGIAGGSSSHSQAGTLGQGGNSTGSTGGWNGSAGGGGYYGGGSGGALGAGGGGGSGYVSPTLTNAQTIAGNATMPNPAGGTMVGNTGNGYVRITW